MMAATSGYEYINSMNDATIVTACVDNINFFDSINVYEDIKINSYATFVGKSSMEV